ncbi:hypothetical protein N9E70_01885 [bacterium]|nr:hypothetical protein [bacterium]
MHRESDVFPTTLVGFSTDFGAALFLHNYLEPSGGNKWTKWSSWRPARNATRKTTADALDELRNIST